jgi:hypothetical protein
MTATTTETALFEIPFASSMDEGDLAQLARRLDLTTHAKLLPSHTSLAFRRLDHASGLFLERGPDEGRWTLKARTWDHPASQSVHEWHVLAASAANQLDPSVTIPERLPPLAPEILQREVGRAQNKRLAKIRRHMVGID